MSVAVPASMFAKQLRPYLFPGKNELLSWIQKHPDACFSRPGIDVSEFDNLRDTRRTYEVRRRILNKTGRSHLGIDQAIVKMRELEQSDPDVPVVIMSGEDDCGVWIVFIVNDKPACAAFVASDRRL